MKIAYITALFPFAHAEQFFEEEVRSLSRQAEVVVIATRPRNAAPCYEDVGSPLYMPLLDRAVAAAALRTFARRPLRTLRALARILLDRKSSLRSRAVNLAAFPKALAVAEACRRLGVDHVHAAWLTTPATIGWVVARLTGLPFSATAHQHDIFSRNLIRPKIAAARFVRIISARNAEHLREQVEPALAAKCIVGHLGVALPERVEAPPERAVPRIVCSARLCLWKGHRFLLSALAMLRERGVPFDCDLAGDGEIRAAVSAQIAQLGLGEVVHLLGNVPHPALVAKLNGGEYDLVALASTERHGEHEGIPVAIMEAMAAALPVVVTRTGSLPELVEPEFGALVPQQDAGALADALERLLRDRALRLAAGKLGRERIRAEFETGVTSRTLLRWFERGP